MKQLCTLFLAFISASSLSQTTSNSIKDILQFDEFLAYVKQYHPIVKQAELAINKSEAVLLKSRGAFDPKISIAYDQKLFKGSTYYDKLNGLFKLPTWYGVEIKANFENNSGTFLNPEANVPDKGLYAVGLKIPLAQGLIINERMAALKQAKLFKSQAKSNRDILTNQVLFDACIAYFNWLRAYNEQELFSNFLKNASVRYQGIKRGVEVGERPQIDLTEARIAINQRKLNLKQANVKLIKKRLELSTFLWLDNALPVELQDNIIPDINSNTIIDTTLKIHDLKTDSITIANHPKLKALDYKLKALEINRRLKGNKLLPKINIEYNFISETPEIARSFNTNAYKGGVQISMPLFLRKERGDLQLAKLKQQDLKLELKTTATTLKNSINALKQELESYITQNELAQHIVLDYKEMLKAEERKFELGESSLFLVNTRESKLIDGQLKAITLEYKYFSTKAKLFKRLAINPSI